MCGLYGWFGSNLVAKQKLDMTTILAWKSTARGQDSWGIVTSEKIWRTLGKFSVTSLSTKRNKKMLADITESNFVLGHTRAASQGEASLKNCHPFKCQDYILQHNGSFFDTTFKSETLILPQGDTDSECFLTWFVSKGIKVEDFLDNDTITKNLTADAFVIRDTSTHKTYIVCLGRELSYYIDKDFMVYASTPEVVTSTVKIVFDKKITVKQTKSFSINEVSEIGIKELKTKEVSFIYGSWKQAQNSYESYYEKVNTQWEKALK